MDQQAMKRRSAAPDQPGGERAKQTRKLGDEQKTFVVLMLAAFESYEDVAGAVRDHFGQTLDPRSIAYYDPECHKGRVCRSAGATCSAPIARASSMRCGAKTRRPARAVAWRRARRLARPRTAPATRRP